MKKTMLILPLIFITLISAAFIHNPTASANSVHPPIACTSIPANPDYLSSGTLADAIAALNTAHAVEHLPSLSLPANFNELNSAHQQFVLINLERTERGLKALRWDNNLATMAQNYSRQMRDLNFFSHTSPISGSFAKRIESNSAIAGHYSAAAENIAGNPVASAGAVYEYMYDDVAENCSHRNNILNKNLTMVGIGEVDGGIYGSMSAQDFLASAPWNPYKGVTPNTTAPSITISAGPSSNGILPISSHIHSNSSGVRITWFVDTLQSQPQMGSILKLNTHSMAHKPHKIFAFAVNGTQNYSLVQLRISL